MSHASIAIVLFSISLISAIVLVPMVMRICNTHGWFDYPAAHHPQVSAIPRLGGIAVYLAFVIGFSCSFILDVDRFPAEVERLMLAMTAASLVVIIMTLDDLGGLSPVVKLATQIVAACIVVLPRLRGDEHGIVIEQFNSPRFGVVTLPLLVTLVFSIIWIVAFMNTLNWIDGIDGLAASITLVTTTILFLHTYFWPKDNPQFTISLLPLCIGAAALGFLPFNWNPARIMLGDSGSNFLGFMLAVAAIIGGAKIATTVLALGLPLLDLSWVIFYRMAHGRSPLTADQGHLHHRLLARGWTQSRIVLFVAGICAIFGVTALALPSKDAKLLALAILGGLLLATVGKFAVQEGPDEPPGPLPDVNSLVDAQ